MKFTFWKKKQPEPLPEEQDYDLVIPEGVQEIRKGDIGSEVCSVKLPKSLRKIADYGFSYSYKITKLTIPDGVRYIGNRAFEGPSRLTQIHMPRGPVQVQDNVFTGCKKLEQVTMPRFMKEIPYGMFDKCSALREITLPEDLKMIGPYAFRECSALTEIAFPEGLEEVGYSAFYRCGSLRSVILPASLKKIDANAFYRCTNLSRITLPEGLEILGGSALAGCDFTEITVPGTVTTLEKGVFSGCNKLKKIVIPDSVTYISRYAFTGCTQLREVVCSHPEKFARALLDTPYWQENHPNTPRPLRLPLDLVGNKTGEVLHSRGYTYLPRDGEYHIDLPTEEGVVMVSAWVDEDGPDEDGFGREEYYDWWLLDEALQPIPGIKPWKKWSRRELRDNKKWEADQQKAAQILQERENDK